MKNTLFTMTILFFTMLVSLSSCFPALPDPDPNERRSEAKTEKPAKDRVLLPEEPETTEVKPEKPKEKPKETVQLEKPEEQALEKHVDEVQPENLPEKQKEGKTDFESECTSRMDCFKLKQSLEWVCVNRRCTQGCTVSAQCNDLTSTRFYDQECFKGQCRTKTCNPKNPAECQGRCNLNNNRYSCAKCSIKKHCAHIPGRNTCQNGKCI